MRATILVAWDVPMLSCYNTLYVRLSRIWENDLIFVLLIIMRRPTFKLMILPTAVGISACLMSFAAFLGWAPGHYLSQRRSRCPPCRRGWDLAPFVYCIYPLRAGVSSAPADLQSLEGKKRVNSWPAALNYLSSVKMAIT